MAAPRPARHLRPYASAGVGCLHERAGSVAFEADERKHPRFWFIIFVIKIEKLWGSGGTADTHGLGPCAARHEGSTPSFPTLTACSGAFIMLVVPCRTSAGFFTH